MELFDDFIDLSQGRPEREIVAQLCEQDAIPVRWVNEGLEIPWEIGARRSGTWREALKNNEDVSAEEWKEQIADIRWHDSPSYRPGIPRPRPYKRRSATPPEGVSVPFFARRTGQIPRNGIPLLDGIQLPRGTRQPKRSAAYWASEEPLSDLAPLLSELAGMFPETGLWPVAWNFPHPPDSYMSGGHHEIAVIDDINVRSLLAERWGRFHQAINGTSHDTEFPGLAAAPPQAQGTFPSSPTFTPAEPAYLLLVPCNRPADAVTALGGIGAVAPPPTTSAVLRSWEERFGAVFYEAEPEQTTVAITRPPQHHDQARALAAELHALDPDISETTGDLEQTAATLLSDDPAPRAAPTITSASWTITWKKDMW